MNAYCSRTFFAFLPTLTNRLRVSSHKKGHHFRCPFLYLEDGACATILFNLLKMWSASPPKDVAACEHKARCDSFPQGKPPAFPTNKKRTFVYRQMFSFSLSKPQACISSAPAGAGYHHASACILLRLDDIHAFGVIW